MKKFEELTSAELWKLRDEIVLNSLYLADYENSSHFNRDNVWAFFDGYVDYLFELAEEDKFPTDDTFAVFDKYDTEENLWAWFCCYDDLSWVKIDTQTYRFSQTYTKTVTWREYYDIEAVSLEDAREKAAACDGDLDDCEDAEFIEAEEDDEYDAEEYQRRDIDTIYDSEGEEVE